MNGETVVERLTKNAEGMRWYQRERAILEVTELVCELMEEAGVARAELAGRIGRSKRYVAQFLDGRAHMTVQDISDVLMALNRSLHFESGPLAPPSSHEQKFPDSP